MGWSWRGWNVDGFGGVSPFHTPWFGLSPRPDAAKEARCMGRLRLLIKVSALLSCRVAFAGICVVAA